MTDTLKHSFFPWAFVEWNKLDLQWCKATYNTFRSHLLKSIQPLSKPINNIPNPSKMRLFTRLRTRPSHLNERRLNHHSEGCIKPLCTCRCCMNYSLLSALSLLQQHSQNQHFKTFWKNLERFTSIWRNKSWHDSEQNDFDSTYQIDGRFSEIYCLFLIQEKEITLFISFTVDFHHGSCWSYSVGNLA